MHSCVLASFPASHTPHITCSMNAGSVGGWVGGWGCEGLWVWEDGLEAEDVRGYGWERLRIWGAVGVGGWEWGSFVCCFTRKQAAEMMPFSLIIWGSLSHPNVCFQIHNLHVAGLYFPQSRTLLRGVQENLQHTSHMNVTWPPVCVCVCVCVSEWVWLTSWVKIWRFFDSSISSNWSSVTCFPAAVKHSVHSEQFRLTTTLTEWYQYVLLAAAQPHQNRFMWVTEAAW